MAAQLWAGGRLTSGSGAEHGALSRDQSSSGKERGRLKESSAGKAGGCLRNRFPHRVDAGKHSLSKLFLMEGCGQAQNFENSFIFTQGYMRLGDQVCGSSRILIWYAHESKPVFFQLWFVEQALVSLVHTSLCQKATQWLRGLAGCVAGSAALGLG